MDKMKKSGQKKDTMKESGHNEENITENGSKGMRNNWKVFVDSTKEKADCHMEIARNWDKVHNTINLILILFSAVTTVVALLENVSIYVTAGLSGLTTLLSAISGFLQPSQRRQLQMESSKEFRTLMFRMVRCETERQYEELWVEYNKALAVEPFVPAKFAEKFSCEHPEPTMTPELVIVIDKKEKEVENALKKNYDEILKDGIKEKSEQKEVKKAFKTNDNEEGSTNEPQTESDMSPLMND